MAKKRFVLVGTGVRAFNFIAPLVQTYRGDSELVGLCDLSPKRMAYYNAQLVEKLNSPARRAN
jgi:predicted dehydrogenase